MEKIVDTDYERDEVIAKLVADAVVDYSGILEGAYITLSNNAYGSIEMIHRFSERRSVVKLLFTPSEKRERRLPHKLLRSDQVPS